MIVFQICLALGTHGKTSICQQYQSYHWILVNVICHLCVGPTKIHLISTPVSSMILFHLQSQRLLNSRLVSVLVYLFIYFFWTCMIIISFWSELRRFGLRKMMMNLMSNFVTSSCDGRCALRSLLPNRGLMASKLLLHMKRSSLTAFRRSRNRVYCELEVIYWVSIVCFVLCKCSAYFESTIILFSGSS